MLDLILILFRNASFSNFYEKEEIFTILQKCYLQIILSEILFLEISVEFRRNEGVFLKMLLFINQLALNSFHHVKYHYLSVNLLHIHNKNINNNEVF